MIHGVINLPFINEPLYLKMSQYENGRPAAVLLDQEGQMYTVISVNMPDCPDLPEDHIYVKDYSENAEIVAGLVRLGVLIPTNYPPVPSGWVAIPVYKLNLNFGKDEKEN